MAVAADDPQPPPLPAETPRAATAPSGEAFKIEVLHRRQRTGTERPSAAGDRVFVAGIRLPAARGAGPRRNRRRLERVPEARGAEARDQSGQHLDLSPPHARDPLRVDLDRPDARTAHHRPIAALAESTRRLRSGDLSARVDVPATDELGVLVDSFNRMAAGLQEARDALLRSNEELQASNRRLELERRLFSTVLESVTTGVLAFDADGQSHGLQSRRAGAARASTDEVTAVALAARPDLEPLVALLDEARPGAPPPAPRELVLYAASGRAPARGLRASPVPRPGGGERGGWVLALEDTTHVAREQKLAAWSEVARRVAHEIKNPLTPIRLSAERIAAALARRRSRTCRRRSSAARGSSSKRSGS